MTSKWFKAVMCKGAGRGKQLGYPTINLKITEILPFKHGVYSVQTMVKNFRGKGILHYGPRPTFDEKEICLEIHLLEFNDNVKPGTEVHFKLLKHLRPGKKFKSKDALINQIRKDAIAAK